MRIKIYTQLLQLDERKLLWIVCICKKKETKKETNKTPYIVLRTFCFCLTIVDGFFIGYMILFSPLICSSSWQRQEGICQVYHNSISEYCFKHADISDLYLLNICCWNCLLFKWSDTLDLEHNRQAQEQCWVFIETSCLMILWWH